MFPDQQEKSGSYFFLPDLCYFHAFCGGQRQSYGSAVKSLGTIQPAEVKGFVFESQVLLVAVGPYNCRNATGVVA